MIADAHTAARDWIIERFHAADCGCKTPERHTPDVAEYLGSLADAALNAPGVAVDTGAAHGDCQHWDVHFDDAWFAAHPGWRPIYRIVIDMGTQPDVNL